jgi:hypothetical protein
MVFRVTLFLLHHKTINCCTYESQKGNTNSHFSFGNLKASQTKKKKLLRLKKILLPYKVEEVAKPCIFFILHV